MGRSSRSKALRRAAIEAAAHDPAVLTPAPDVPAEWANTAVRLRVPSGTDPLAALREAMGVFMERVDGTNALEWWQRVRWWHGGPAGLRQGDWLQPPSVTGIVPPLVGTDKTSVYVTTRQEYAIMFAAPFGSPCLYEVTLRDEPVRDDTTPNDASNWRVPRARVHRALSISNRQLAMARMALEYGANRPDVCEPPDCPPVEDVQLG